MDGYQLVDVDRLFPSPTNPRKRFDPDKLNELAESIKAKGLLQPILVRPAPDFELVPGRLGSRSGFLWESRARSVHGGYAEKREDGDAVCPLEVVAGERRLRAAKLAGLDQVPVIVRELSDVDAVECQVIENDQRADVLPSERAAGYRALLKAGRSVEDVAAKIGQSVSTVRGFLLLESCPEDLLAAVDAGKVGRTTAELVCRLPKAADQDLAARCVLAGCTDPAALSTRPANGNYFGEVLSYRETKELVAHHFQRELKGAPFKPADKKLLPGVPSCMDCPKRVGNARLAEPDAYDGTRDDVCLDPACYREKCQAQERRDALKAQAAPPANGNGRTPLPTVGSVGEWVGSMKAAGAQAAGDRKRERAEKAASGTAPKGHDGRFDRLFLGELAVSAEALFGAVLPKADKTFNRVLRLMAQHALHRAHIQAVERAVIDRRGLSPGSTMLSEIDRMDGDQLVGFLVELVAGDPNENYRQALAKALQVNPKDVERRARKEAAEANGRAKAAPVAKPKPSANGHAGRPKKKRQRAGV